MTRAIQAAPGPRTLPGARPLLASHVAAAVGSTRGAPPHPAPRAAGAGQNARNPSRAVVVLPRPAPSRPPLAPHVARALATHTAQARPAPVAGATRPVAPHVQAALGRNRRSAAVQPAMPARVVQRMEEDWFRDPYEDFDDEIHEQDEFGNTVYKEPEEGWEAYGKGREEEYRQQMEWEESEHFRAVHEQWQEQQKKEVEEYEKHAPSLDELIDMQEQHYEATYGKAIKVAQEFGTKEYLEAVHYLAKLDQRRIPNADRLLANFVQAMQHKEYAYASGYLFQIQQTYKLEDSGFKLLQVEPSLYESIGQNRFGDTLVLDPKSGRKVIVEIKNWTGYLKGAAKKSSMDVKNEREKERTNQLAGLREQLERYLQTNYDVLFIWKGQLAIDVMMSLNSLSKEHNGRFRYKTAS
ncbi:MAG TPA: hypothetical protein VF789_20735 [Thermoanaerobaculia bacterium]